MSFEPDPLQVLFLWALLAQGGEAWKTDLKPDPKGKYGPLLTSGLVEEESLKHPATRARRKRVRLSERGWVWAQGHLDAPLSARSTAGAAILQAFLARLKAYLAEHDVALAEVVAPGVQARAAAGDLPGRVRDAYWRAAGGRWNVRVPLAALRTALADVPRGLLDETLLAMSRERRLALYPADDPRGLSDADRSAAISVAGQMFQIVYMDA
jgi:hypothetical protein